MNSDTITHLAFKELWNLEDQILEGSDADWSFLLDAALDRFPDAKPDDFELKFYCEVVPPAEAISSIEYDEVSVEGGEAERIQRAFSELDAEEKAYCQAALRQRSKSYVLEDDGSLTLRLGGFLSIVKK